ncbi:MAG: hypothetical protein Q7U82_04125 [Gammaproteobacteria bacterium]|nr:hypothetical protein [Gammaproteobacteria bacterium]
MSSIKFTLVSDGSSDRVLIPVLKWLLTMRFPECAVNSDWADLGRLKNPPKTLAEKIKMSVVLYPCDLLFVHRDAEKQSSLLRVQEIDRAFADAQILLNGIHTEVPPYVKVIPVVMSEAWLLFNESAIRSAAANPNGTVALNLPPIRDLENLPSPKEMLYGALIEACGLVGRRKRSFRPQHHIHLLADYIEDYSPLMELSAFLLLKSEIDALQPDVCR